MDSGTLRFKGELFQNKKLPVWVVFLFLKVRSRNVCKKEYDAGI